MKPRFSRNLNRFARGLLVLVLLVGLIGFVWAVPTQANAYAGNALSFNTQQQYGHFGNDPSLNAATSIRTMEAWVKFHSLDGQQQIIAKACGSSGMEVSLNFGELNVYVSGAGGSNPVSYSTANLQTERWYHLAATHNGPGTTITLYVDGVPVATGTAAAVIRDSSEDPDPTHWCDDPYHHEMRIASWGGGGQFLNGELDEVRIWNTPRTGDQIRDNMYRELTGDETGLVGYYPLNETSGLTVPDRSTTVKSLPVTTGGSGYLSIPSVTVSGGDGSGAAGAVAAMRVNSVISITNGGAGYAVNDVLTVNGGTFTAPAVFTVTSVTGGVVTSIVISDTGAYSALPTNSVSVSGGSGAGATFDLDWAVRLLQLMSAGSGYITTAPNVTFSSGNATATANIHNDGTLYVPPPPLSQPAAWVTSGAFYGPRHALDFDGVNDYVSANSPLSVIGPGTNLTLMAWIRPNAIGTQDILSLGSLNSAEVAELRLNSLNQLEYGRNPAAWQSVTSANPIGTGTWTHVAVVQSGATLQLYINGVPDTTGSINSTTNLTDIYLGTRRYAGANDQFFNGQLDEVRLWNTALTAVQIQDDMNRSLAGDETGLIGYYRMDYGAAAGGNAAFTTLYDITANGNDGTLNNFALTGTTSNWVDSAAFNTWVGTEGAVWTNAGNWSRGVVPTAADNLLIASYPGGNSPIITSTVAVNHVVIGTGGYLAFSGANALTVNGNWIGNGNLTAANSLITFGSGVTHNLVLNSATTFYNLTVNSGDILNEVVSTDNATVGGTLTNNGIVHKSQVVSATGARSFGLTGVAVNIDTLGNLGRLTVDRVDANHPNAGDAAMQTGRYWRITRALSGGTTEGQLDITLPYAASGLNSKACRWVNGSGAGFDCGQASDNSAVNNMNVTRLNYLTADWAAQGTNFDLWTVGSSVTPTAIRLNELHAAGSEQARYGWLALVLVISGGGAVLFSLRRRKA